MLDLRVSQNYIFLGDYVDRSRNGLEVLGLLLSLKLRYAGMLSGNLITDHSDTSRIRYPDKIYLLRGNHECAAITRMYGFHDECKRRFSIKVRYDHVWMRIYN